MQFPCPHARRSAAGRETRGADDAVRVGRLSAVGAIPIGQGRAAVEAGVLGRRAAGGGIFKGVGGYYLRQVRGVIE